jgi:hypothetical protein
MGCLERALPAWGELVGTFLAKDPLEHQIVHLELPAAHESFVVAPKRLLIPCIFNSRLPSSLINQVNIFTLELVLHGFIVRLDMERAHGDLRGEDGLSPVHYEERRLTCVDWVMSDFPIVRMEAY